jgi:hypothetical protein
MLPALLIVVIQPSPNSRPCRAGLPSTIPLSLITAADQYPDCCSAQILECVGITKRIPKF